MSPEFVAPADEHLAAAVRSVIASKRIGTPVFVRVILQGPDEGDSLLAKLSRMAFLARQWLGQDLLRCQAMGSLETGQVNLALTFSGGATALVSYSRSLLRGDGLDVTVLGNHGAIYHDIGAGNRWDEALAIKTESQPPLTLDLLRRALQSGKPLAVGT
jgi:hypothetical protein